MEVDIPRTTIWKRYGHHEVFGMSFRLTNAPSTFMELTNRECGDCLDKFVMVLIDDILVYSQTIE